MYLSQKYRRAKYKFIMDHFRVIQLKKHGEKLKTNLFRLDRRYMSKCNGYSDNSATCIKGLDKSFCGIYKQFEQSKIEIYTAITNASSVASQNCISKVKYLEKQ
jgi:hypothetical protein